MYILESQISIWYPSQNMTVLGGKTLVGNHRGQTFLVVGHQVCTYLRRDFVSLLFADPLQVIWGWRLATRTFSSLHRFSMGWRSGDWLDHSRTLMCFFLSHSFVALAVCFGSLSCWKTHPWPIFSVLAEESRFSSNNLRYIGPSMR